MAKNKIDLGSLEPLILNYSIYDRSFWLKIVDNVKSDYFEKNENQKVFSYFYKYFKEYNEIPPKDILVNEIRNLDEEYVEELYSKDNISKKDYVYEKTLNFIKRNLTRQAIQKSIDLMEKDRFEEIESEIKNVIKFNLDTSLGMLLTNVEERYQKILDMQREKVPSGFPTLDAILHGGWSKKELYACAAPPGVGKSIFLANWAIGAVKQGYNAVTYTLEISEERLTMRHDSILTKIPTDELIIDLDSVKKKYKLFAKAQKSNMWVKEFPTKGVTVNAIKAHLEQLKIYENFVPDIIFVDYAGLLKPSYRAGDGYEDLKTIFEDLRGLAVEMEIPIVTAAQTNRKSLDEKGGTKEIITQAQVADSLGITQTLDMFLTIIQSRVEKEEGIIKLYVDKHRNGEASKELSYTIDYRTFELEEMVA